MGQEGLSLKNGVQSRGQNRTRESRPSGIAGGYTETWAMVELGTRCTTERVQVGNSLPKAARVVFLPDSRTLRLTRRGLETWHGEIVHPSYNRKSGTGNPPPKQRAPALDPTCAGGCRVTGIPTAIEYHGCKGHIMLSYRAEHVRADAAVVRSPYMGHDHHSICEEDHDGDPATGATAVCPRAGDARGMARLSSHHPGAQV